MFENPLDCLNNDGQRLVLCVFLKYLKIQIETPNSEDRLRGIISGIAGTGKSFVVKLMNVFAKLATGKMNSIMNTAPTGASAGANGSQTIDRVKSIKRTKSTFESLPISKLAILQQDWKGCIGTIADEMGMCGLKLFGHSTLRDDEIFNEGKYVNYDLPDQGHIRISLIGGDHKQLSPVLDTPVYSRNSIRNELCNIGLLFYKNHNQY